jgi:predicted HicB family RNase H-like nuclease
MTPDYLSKYTYRIDWSEEDDCFLGRCLEFPSLIAHGDTRELTLKEIQLVVLESVKWMIGDREELPIPLSIRTYSGKLSLRIPPETHKRLAIEAAEEKISLNQLLTSYLESRQGTVSIKKSVEAVFDRMERLEAAVQRFAVMVTNRPRTLLGNWIEQSQAGMGIVLETNTVRTPAEGHAVQMHADVHFVGLSNSLFSGTISKQQLWTFPVHVEEANE